MQSRQVTPELASCCLDKFWSTLGGIGPSPFLVPRVREGVGRVVGRPTGAPAVWPLLLFPRAQEHVDHGCLVVFLVGEDRRGDIGCELEKAAYLNPHQ